MATSPYEEVLSRARQLERADQLRLMQELAAYMQHQMSATGSRSIRELHGLGKEIWEGVDAQAYVDAERDSWDG